MSPPPYNGKRENGVTALENGLHRPVKEGCDQGRPPEPEEMSMLRDYATRHGLPNACLRHCGQHVPNRKVFDLGAM